jgi:uncharacterized protein
MQVQPSDARGSGAQGLRPNRGPFSSEAEALTELVARLVRGLDPDEVWLFGSRAERRNAPDSDFDLFVVTRVSDGDAGFDYNVVYAPIRGLGVGCDVVPCRADEFEDERNDPTSLCWHVIHTGQKLYERAA